MTDSPSVPDDPHAAYHAEYSEAANLLRHYSSLRFAIMPIYFAAAGALAAYAVGAAASQPPRLPHQQVASGAAVLITLVFMAFELTCTRYLKHFRRRLCELEKDLGYETMSTRPDDHGLVQIASTMLYAAMLAFWIGGSIEGVTNFMTIVAAIAARR